MTTRTVELTEDLDKFVTTSISNGEYPDVSAVMQVALVALQHKRDDETKMKALMDALEEGDASGVFEGNAFESVRKEMGWTAEL